MEEYSKHIPPDYYCSLILQNITAVMHSLTVKPQKPMTEVRCISLGAKPKPYLAGTAEPGFKF